MTMKKDKFLRRFFWLLLLPVFLISCARQPSVDNFYFGPYSEAESLYNHKQYEKAIQKYQAYVDENPEGNLAVIAKYYMGRSYAAIGKKDEAKTLFEKIVQEHPDLVWANFAQSQMKEMDKAGTSASEISAKK